MSSRLKIGDDLGEAVKRKRVNEDSYVSVYASSLQPSQISSRLHREELAKEDFERINFRDLKGCNGVTRRFVEPMELVWYIHSVITVGEILST